MKLERRQNQRVPLTLFNFSIKTVGKQQIQTVLNIMIQILLDQKVALILYDSEIQSLISATDLVNQKFKQSPEQLIIGMQNCSSTKLGIPSEKQGQTIPNTSRIYLPAIQQSFNSDKAQQIIHIPSQNRLTLETNNRFTKPKSQSKSKHNKISVFSSQKSNTLIHKNSEESLSKKITDNGRGGGIRVTSRNSSISKNSQTSVDKTITSADLNRNYLNTGSGVPFCGISCKTGNAFTQNEDINQVALAPNLYSLDFFQNHLTQNEILSSERNRSKSIQENNSLAFETKKQKNQNNSQIVSSSQKLFKNVRQMMQNQIKIAKKLYQKKYLGEIQCLNLTYNSHIETLQRVLGQNQTIINQQSTKLKKLQKTMNQISTSLNQYLQKLTPLEKFFNTTYKFALDRTSEVEQKLSILLTYISQANFVAGDSIAFSNKVKYLQSIFAALVAQTIKKYRSIEFELKDELKQMLKKYDYFEQKIYEMDVMKHLGKQNQIQNYQLTETIEGIKEKIFLLQNKFSMKISLCQPQPTKSIQQIEELKGQIFAIRMGISRIEVQYEKSLTKIYHLEVKNLQLQNQIPLLQGQIHTLKTQISEAQLPIKIQKNQQNLSQNSQKVFYLQEQCKRLNNSNKKDLKEQKRLQKQIEQLNKVLSKYECKIQQLYLAIDNLQQQNFNIKKSLNQKSLNQKNFFNYLQKEKDYSQAFENISLVLSQKDQILVETQKDLAHMIKQRDDLAEALNMVEHIFDQQIFKFKQTIKSLQEQNHQLMTQINSLRTNKTEENINSPECSIKNINSSIDNNKISLSKSPKREMFGQGWLKKSISKLGQNHAKEYFQYTQLNLRRLKTMDGAQHNEIRDDFHINQEVLFQTNQNKHFWLQSQMQNNEKNLKFQQLKASKNFQNQEEESYIF